jgi:hypothetical protein
MQNFASSGEIQKASTPAVGEPGAFVFTVSTNCYW